jgi:hypothetical protein
MTPRHVLLHFLSRRERYSGTRCAVAADITNRQRRLRSVVEILAAAHGIAGAVSGVPGAGARTHAGRWDFADHVAGADVAADAHGLVGDLAAELRCTARWGAAWGGGSGWRDGVLVGKRAGHVDGDKGSVGVGVV